MSGSVVQWFSDQLLSWLAPQEFQLSVINYQLSANHL